MKSKTKLRWVTQVRVAAGYHEPLEIKKMTNEEILLVNDVVKVGFPIMGTLLGGIIGATSTYVITRLNHNNESKKETLNKRHELILQAANDIAEFEHLIGTYATAVNNHILKIDGAIDMDSARHNIINNNQPLRRARMTLKILGLKTSEEHLEKYLNFTREVITFGPNLNQKRASELAKAIVKGPTKFYESLSSEILANK